MLAYAIADNDLLLDAPERSYILKIRDLAADQKPREKLLKHGAQALSSQELVAVLLGTGTKREGVLEMASRVVKEYGEKSLASQTDAKKFADDLGIPLVKAMQIVSALELGRRFHERKSGALRTIRTAKDVFHYFRDMQDLPKEHLRGIYLNNRQQIIHDEAISIGTVNANLIHPREVFKPAIEYGAAGVILAHNHPSGTATPSDADIEVTRQIIQAGKIVGINLLDHVIIAKNKYESVKVDYD